MSKQDAFKVVPYRDTPHDDSDTTPLARGSYNPQSTDHVNVYIEGDDSPFPWTWTGMVCSILAMLCCLCPLGMVATFFSGKAFVSHGLSQFKKARREMQLAKKLALAALIVGIIVIVIYAAIEIVVIKMLFSNTLKKEFNQELAQANQQQLAAAGQSNM